MSEQKQLDRIEAKIDKLDARQNRMEITQVAQHLTLEEHTKRSTMLEAIVLPMQKKMNMAEGALKLVGIVAMLAGIVDVILRAFRL